MPVAPAPRAGRQPNSLPPPAMAIWPLLGMPQTSRKHVAVSKRPFRVKIAVGQPGIEKRVSPSASGREASSNPARLRAPEHGPVNGQGAFRIWRRGKITQQKLEAKKVNPVDNRRSGKKFPSFKMPCP